MKTKKKIKPHLFNLEGTRFFWKVESTNLQAVRCHSKHYQIFQKYRPYAHRVHLWFQNIVSDKNSQLGNKPQKPKQHRHEGPTKQFAPPLNTTFRPAQRKPLSGCDSECTSFPNIVNTVEVNSSCRAAAWVDTGSQLRLVEKMRTCLFSTLCITLWNRWEELWDVR